MKMNELETELFKIMPDELLGYLNQQRIPDLYHCIGTQKIIGEHLGNVICDICDLSNLKIRRDLTVLSTFLRSFIVLDDFLKDHIVEPYIKSYINIWLDRIKDKIINILSKFRDIDLWDEYYTIYNSAFFEFDCRSLFQSINKKCYLIFLLFDLKCIRKHKNSIELKFVFMNYLFGLQLLDDFHDIEEDLNAPKNHNLFTIGLSIMNQKIVSQYRPLLFSSLLEYINNNFHNLKTFNHPIIIKYLNAFFFN